MRIEPHALKEMFSKTVDSSKVVKPVPAATIVLLRDRKNGEFEVFLMQRHKEQAFMGGAYVFPGGRMDRNDCETNLSKFVLGLSPPEAKTRLNESELDDETALGLYLCAVRETFEESGVLLAENASGEKINFRDSETASRFARYRRQLNSSEFTLLQFAVKEDIRFQSDRMVPYSRWITPEVESRRFDTRFFIARMPRDQAPIHDAMEMTKSLWTTPAKALNRQKAREIILMPPTLKTLEELADFSSIDMVFSIAYQKQIQPILPQAFSEDKGFGVKLPHDPEYSLPRYKQPPRPLEASRIVMIGDRWRAMCAEEFHSL
jgi:8-oxo-dGTP pyrophosphatase MutT (NUDIX family)